MTKAKKLALERYLPLLIQLRLLADQNGDKRSLVAIVSIFEREAGPVCNALKRSLETKAHCRNAA